MKNKIDKELILNYLKKILGVWDNPILSKVKNVFAWIGVFTSLYLIFFFSFTRPQEIKESQEREKIQENEIQDFSKRVIKLEKQKETLEKEVVILQNELEDLQKESDKNKKEYEKKVRYISNLSNNQLSKLFADTFKDPK